MSWMTSPMNEIPRIERTWMVGASWIDASSKWMIDHVASKVVRKTEMVVWWMWMWIDDLTEKLWWLGVVCPWVEWLLML